MSKDYEEIIGQSIQIELQLADLYLLFYNKFPKDAEFWWKIALEEKNHAALIRSLEDVAKCIDELPEEMFSSSLEELTETNKMLTSVVHEFTEKLPDRSTAFNTALRIEESAGELHYQGFMENDDESSLQISTVFRRLNKEDKDHSLRIRAYMKANGISES